jgi:soluble lytic murein transglycosylase-like protein
VRGGRSGSSRRPRLLLRVVLLFGLFGGLGLAVGVGVFALGFTPTPVKAMIRDYLADERALRYREEIIFAAEESGVDPYLLAGLMVRESSGDKRAKSSAGAVGLFQLRPITYRWRAEEMGLEEPTENDLLDDALLNTRLGANNMAWLLATYDGDTERALVAYNLGTGKLKKYCDAAGGWEAWRAERAAAGSSNLLAYAAKVLEYAEAFREKQLFEKEEGNGPEEGE